MIIKDEGKLVTDDYSNIENVGKILKLKNEEIALLKRANGLRNVLVHEYNGVVDELAYER